MYNYYDFEAEFPQEKSAQKFLMSDYFHDSRICSINMDHDRRELVICLQCQREWEESEKGAIEDARYTYILRFAGVYGLCIATDLSWPEYINGRFKQTAWLRKQQKQTKRKLYQFRIGLADGYLDIVFQRFFVRKAEGRISYAGVKEVGAFYKNRLQRSPEKLAEIRDELNNTSQDSLNDDYNLEILYANSTEDLPQQCRRILTGEASQAAKAYAAWLLGKCGTPKDLPLIWEAFRAEKERECIDCSFESPMRDRNYLDSVEQLTN